MDNHGPDPATLHVLPTLWFRNTWAWGLPGQEAVPSIRVDDDLLVEHPTGSGTKRTLAQVADDLGGPAGSDLPR